VFREMSRQTAWRMFGASSVVLLVQVMMLCPTTFSPGWANGWPGISKHTVFAGYISGMLLIAELAVATGPLALLGAGLERMVKKVYVGWSAFSISMAIVLPVAIFLASKAYPAIRASIASDWP